MTERLVEEELAITVRDVPACPRCGQAGILLASYPHSWTNAHGVQVTGRGESLLCAACDHAEPAAADLLALFLVDGHVGLDNLALLRCLADAWVEALRDRKADASRLAGEEELWLRGEL